MKKIKEVTWYDLKDEELKEFATFLRSSLGKDATFKGMVKNVKAALNNSHLSMTTYIPTLGANVLCEGQEFLDVMDKMAKEMSLANDATNQRTEVGVGLPQGLMEIPESNVWFVEMKSRAHARALAKGFSEHDVVVIGLEVEGHSISVHVAYKDEVENNDKIHFLPFTSKFLTRLMGYAA